MSPSPCASDPDFFTGQRYLAIRLRQRGFSVTTTRDARMAGKTDAEQLAYATCIDARLVSYDSLDYRRLHRISAAHSGIVLISNVRLDWQEVRTAMLIDWVATFPNHRSHLFAGMIYSLQQCVYHEISRGVLKALRNVSGVNSTVGSLRGIRCGGR